MARAEQKVEKFPAAESAKALGAFYTDAQIADFLVWWAIRSTRDTVMDPSFGGGVFLRSACQRLIQLGGHPAGQVFGVEIDPEVHARIGEKLSDEFGVRKQNLVLGDFFDLEPLPVRQVNAVVGNPPFIRYQRFSGEVRNRALMRAAEEGVRLTELSSSWAPFLIHSLTMLKPEGRLAMVVPMEIGHAAYALPVLQHLAKSFGQVIFLAFQKKLFPDLSEDTLLLLAEDRGASHSRLLIRDLAHAGQLAEIRNRGRQRLPGTRRLNTPALTQGRERLVEYFIPKKARDLYHELKALPETRRLGELADVGIGYVTGANDFFHLSPQDVLRWGIPEPFLRPAIRRGRVLTGLRFTGDDWRKALEVGEAGYLLYVEADADLPESVRRYVEHGEANDVHQAFKCRSRSPWFRVPHVYQPDAFLSYMSGATPRLVANDAGVVAPNSLHILRLRSHVTLSNDSLAALWQTSLTRLSAEIEGHSLGGGMLKVEPTEAENVIVALPPHGNGRLATLANELDALMRKGDDAGAQARADTAILREGIGLSASECRLLEVATNTLRHRRYSRGVAA